MLQKTNEKSNSDRVQYYCQTLISAAEILIVHKNETQLP